MLQDISLLSSDEITYDLYSGSAYLQQLVADLDQVQSGETASVSTMNLDPTNEQVLSVLNALSRAAVEGAEVTLAVDSFALMDAKVGPLCRVDTAMMRDSTIKHTMDKYAALSDRFHTGTTLAAGLRQSM